MPLLKRVRTLVVRLDLVLAALEGAFLLMLLALPPFLLVGARRQSRRYSAPELTSGTSR